MASVWHWTSEGDERNIYTHTRDNFHASLCLMTKDVTTFLANTAVVNTALVILVTGSALTQLNSFLQNISDPTFPNYVTTVSS